MRVFKTIRLRVRSLFQGRRVDRELDAELRDHLDRQIEHHVRAGLSAADARAAALKEFGNVALIQEQSRDARGTRALEELVTDLRHGGRLLLRNRTFSVVAVLSIGLAIGVNTTIFSLVDAVLLRTLPVRDPSGLVFLNVAAEDGELHAAPPYPCFERFRSARALSGMAAFTFDSMPVVIDGRAERALVQLASASYFDVLGVPATLGRTFVASDERLDPPVAVLSHEYWQRRFGGTRDVLGRIILYNDRVLTVVGVSAQRFTGLQTGRAVDLTVPITLAGAERLTATGRWWMEVVGRLATGTSREQSEAELNPIFHTFMEETGASAGMRASFSRVAAMPAAYGLRELREEFSKPLLLVAAIAAMVLLIACANVANLLVARAAARRHEFATRAAIGASRVRLLRQLLAESLVLGAVGTCVGLLVARWLLATLTARAPLRLELPFDYRVVAFSVALCFMTSLLFGLAPAVRTARDAALTDLRRLGASPLVRRLGLSPGAVLVVVQVTLSLVLLVATTLLIVTLISLRSVDAGFRPEGVTTFEVEFLGTEASVDLRSTRWTMLVDRMQVLPGVQSASVSWLTPLSPRHQSGGLRVLEAGPPVECPRPIALNHVSADYFGTMGIPLRRGRAFTSRDDGRQEGVAIVSEAAARCFFGGADPVGRRVSIARQVREIVGVVGDTKHLSLREEIPGFVYVPVSQPVERMDSLFLAVRTQGEPAGVVDGVRRELSALGSDVVVGNATTMREQIDRTLVRERLMATSSLSLGGFGVVLWAVGLFGVMSSSVLRRRREIAVRMALGASVSDVRGRVLREALLIAAAGGIVGVPISWIGARALENLLFGVEPTSVPIMAGCVGLLITVAASAAYLPAWRASRLDPAALLRAE